MTFGITPEGFNTKRLIDVKDQLDNAFVAEFGDINLDAQSVTGQLIGIFSKVYADLWENLAQVYVSQYPNSASGIALDNVVALNGLTRLPAERTQVIAAVTGALNTFIPAGSLARIPSSQEVFFSLEAGSITNGNAIGNDVTLTNAAELYTISLNSQNYNYGLPNITFSAPLVAGNVVSIRVNGITQPPVPFNTSNLQTLNDIIAMLVTNLQFTSGAVSTTVSTDDTIELQPILGKESFINSVLITGPGATTATISYRSPGASVAATYLAAIISVASSPVVATANTNIITIRAKSDSSPYSINVGSNLSISQTWSPINFASQNFGPIPAPANTLTQIDTPVAGWTAITNFGAGVTGRFQETDTELRARRLLSLRSFGSATPEAIRSAILQRVPAITSVTIFENITMTQQPIQVTFDSIFAPADVIIPSVDGVATSAVVYTTSQAVTMGLIANSILENDDVLSVIVSGPSNTILDITMKEGETITVSFAVPLGNGYTLSGGRPPKSFEAVVEGGDDQAIADVIWLTKPAGIQTFGNESEVVIDSQGNSQPIFFSRANPVYLWTQITLVTGVGFPVDGQQQVAQILKTYGDTLGVGLDVYIQRVQAEIFKVPGIISTTVQLAATNSPSSTPSYAGLDIPISQLQISVWDLTRISVSI